MLSIIKASKLGAALIAGAVVLGSAPTSSYAETGAVRFTVARAGFIVGMGGGRGVLRFRGKTYPLRVGGISAGTIGVSQADVVGTARNLRTASDIVGTYSAVGGSLAVAGGGGTARLQNARGVVLEVRSRTVGFEASLNLGGVTISME
jgi:hypothetical protein